MYGKAVHGDSGVFRDMEIAFHPGIRGDNTYMGGRDFGPSGVRALPLAAGINVGGHYKWHFFSFFLSLSLSSGLIANSPRRDCRRVLKFCMGS